MSSLRNAVKRITHKERGQPQARAHLGHLEKHVDYKFRAKDYHRKQDTLRAMRLSASMRNPDEFYFGMHNAEIRNGQHRKTQAAKQRDFEAKVGIDTIKLMKNQDLSYVRMLKQQDVKQVERIHAASSATISTLHHPLAGSMDKKKNQQPLKQHSNTKKPQHTVFVDSREEAEAFNVAEYFDTVPELAGRSFNRLRKSQIVPVSTSTANEFDIDFDNNKNDKKAQLQLRRSKETVKRIAKAHAATIRELDARNQRIQSMELAEAHLMTEKLVASKGRKRKIADAKDGKPAQYKLRRRRLG